MAVINMTYQAPPFTGLASVSGFSTYIGRGCLVSGDGTIDIAAAATESNLAGVVIDANSAKSGTVTYIPVHCGYIVQALAGGSFGENQPLTVDASGMFVSADSAGEVVWGTAHTPGSAGGIFNMRMNAAAQLAV